MVEETEKLKEVFEKRAKGGVESKTEATRISRSSWGLSALEWKIEAWGLKLLVEGFKEKKVLGSMCHKCGTTYVPASFICRKCFIEIDRIVSVSDRGRVVSYAVNMADVRGKPLEEISVVCQVQLDGTESALSGTLFIDDWKKVYVGMPVKIKWAEKTEGKLGDMEGFELIELATMPLPKK